MDFKHKRGNILILFDKITQIPILILAIIISIVFLKEDFNPQAFIPILFVALSPLMRIIKYLFTYYTIEDSHLIIETGILNRKRKEIPFRVITTVDLSQNIFFQLFKTYRIKINNASQTNDTIDKAEVVLALKADEAFKFKQIITQNTMPKVIIDKNANVIIASPLDFIKHGLLQSKLAYFITGGSIAVPVIGVITSFATGSKSSEELFYNIFDQASSGTVVFFIIAFFYLIATSISIIKSVFTYYNFRISGDIDSLKIEYGLFNKKKFTLKKSKINGIILKQNLLMRVFKCYTAEILVIGYGDKSEDEAREQAILYPIASIKKIESIIKELLPEFELQHDRYKPNLNAIKYFFYNAGFVIASLLFLSLLFTKNIFAIVFAGSIVIFVAISVVLQYFNTSIFSGDKNIILSFGGYHKKIAIVKTASVESITAKGSILKRKKGFVSINLGFVAPKRDSIITALNLPIEQFNILKDMIKY